MKLSSGIQANLEVITSTVGEVSVLVLEGLRRYVVAMVSGSMTYKPSFMMIDSGIQVILRLFISII
jgi:hypothetical protein